MHTYLPHKVLCFLALLLCSFAYTQNHALNFDGIDDYVQFPDFILEDKFTIEFRFQADELSLVPFEERIISLGPTMRLEIGLEDLDGITQLWLFDQSNFILYHGTPGYDLRDGQWHQAAVVYDGSQVLVYVDGILTGSEEYAGELQPFGPFMRFGAWTGALSTRTFFNGSVDEVRFWDSALSPSDIAAGLDCQISGDELGLIAYWDFNQGVAGGNNADENILQDRTPLLLDGQLTDFQLSGTASNWLDSGSPDIYCDFVSVDDPSATFGHLSFYPNPTLGPLQLDGVFLGKVAVEIFNTQGQLIGKEELHLGDDLDLSGAPAGVYLIKTSIGKQQFVNRIVKL